jgi:hypothetical protein
LQAIGLGWEGTLKVNRWVFAVIGAMIFAGAAGAATLFTDFGPGQTYNTSTSWTIAGSGTAFHQSIASSFTPSVTATLDSLDLGVNVFAGTTSFTVEITADSSGAPGAVLESFSLTGITGSATVRSLTSVLHPSLSSLSTYWIAVFPGGTTTFGGWNLNSVGRTGFDSSANDGSTWSGPFTGASPAFDVIGTPTVPEPTTWVLLAAPLAAMLWFRRRRA